MMIAVGFINRQKKGGICEDAPFLFVTFTNELRSLAHNHYEYATLQDKDY